MKEFNLDSFLSGVVLPPLPPYPRGAKVDIEPGPGYDSGMNLLAPERVEQTQFGTPQTMPLRMKLTNGSEDWWLLPVEPLITINGKNVLVKRNVAKSQFRGTIKERWMQDDYSISIQGLFTRQDSYEFPAEDLRRLRMLCEARDTIDVLCPIFEELKISRVVIESYDFPLTKGEENQNWTIQALSDDDWSLLLDIDNNSDVL